MQNEIQSLKSQLSKVIEEKEKQTRDMKTLCLQMAELKGLLARLTMEADMPNTTNREPPLETKSEEHTRKAKHELNDVERFADAFLQQQRMSLISCLVRYSPQQRATVCTMSTHTVHRTTCKLPQQTKPPRCEALVRQLPQIKRILQDRLERRSTREQRSL
jgi:transcriptional regulator of heat shock response